MKRTAFGFLLALLLAWAGHAANAQNTISAGTVTIHPGDTGVVVPISATTGQPLTLLNVALTFNDALCQAIVNQKLVRVGRTVGAPQEDGIRCPIPKVAIVLFDLSGNPVLPAGSGEIIHWVFDVKPSANGGVYPITVTVMQSSDGPVSVPLTPSDGEVTIVGPMCPGDCNDDGQVSVDELLLGVNIALGTDLASRCVAVDPDQDGTVTVTELIAAVNAALNSCSP